MLKDADIITFVPTRDPAKARVFYEQTLGLQFLSEDQFALLFDAHGRMLRVVNVSSMKDFHPQPFTILGWIVENAERAVRSLGGKGVEFQRYPAMDQNPLGIWHSPSGAKVAWFKDPDGNVLSITEA